jgi:hypothetical protein
VTGNLRASVESLEHNKQKNKKRRRKKGPAREEKGAVEEEDISLKKIKNKMM